MRSGVFKTKFRKKKKKRSQAALTGSIGPSRSCTWYALSACTYSLIQTSAKKIGTEDNGRDREVKFQSSIQFVVYIFLMNI